MIESRKYTVQVTVLLEKGLWIGIFERKDDEGYAVARKIFGGEPSDPELYEFVLTNYSELKFSSPQDIVLVIQRKNPKRLKREVKRTMEKAKQGQPPSSHAQEALRLELEKNKKVKKTLSKEQKEAEQERKFSLKQAKRKQKHKGH